MQSSSPNPMFEKLTTGNGSAYIGIGVSDPKGVIPWPSKGSTLEQANEQIRLLSGHGTNQIIVLNIKNYDEFDEEDPEAAFGLVEAQIQILADGPPGEPILLGEKSWEKIKDLEKTGHVGINQITCHQSWLVKFY